MERLINEITLAIQDKEATPVPSENESEENFEEENEENSQ